MSPDNSSKPQEFRSGFVGIIGRPNIGKSTLLNAFIGRKISIVSPKPQTTRHRILGILNHDRAQICFVDVPGIHKPQENIHKIMIKTAISVLDDSDCIICLVPSLLPGNSEKYILNMLEKIKIPVILALNKVDKVKKKEKILVLIDEYRKFHDFAHIVPISALHKTNVDALLEVLITLLPVGPPLFPAEMLTDRSEAFQIAELIREKVFLNTHEEIPYSVGIIIEGLREGENRHIVVISALIVVEKASHKAIVIGKKASQLKIIGSQARLEIENLLQKKVFLDLHVKHVSNWKSDPRYLKKIGLD